MTTPAPATDRFERACREMQQALANFMGAIAAELRRIESTVPPHSHPPDARSPAVTDRSGSAVFGAAPVGGCLDVSSLQPAPAKPIASPATFSPGSKWTPERKELLRETYPNGTELADIHRQLNALPGHEITKKQIGAYAATQGWKRQVAAEQPKPAEPAKPVQQRAIPAPKVPLRWTVERIPEARRLYQSGAEMDDIIAALTALPGSMIGESDISIFAAARGWTRGRVKSEPAPAPAPAVPPAPRAVAAPKPAAVSVPAKIGDAQPVPASGPQIIQWAGERGIIVSGRDVPMDLINAKRRHLGMPPFVLTMAPRAAAR
jgi:hypothetical protein